MQNRETWLQAVAVLLATTYLRPAGYQVPQVRIAAGFPSKNATGRKTRTIGECWPASAAADGLAQIFISPLLADTVEVVATLAHELAHAVVGTKAGHRAPFAKCAAVLGLEGKITATHAGAQLAAWVRDSVVRAVGEYPHAALTAIGADKKQTTRMIKCTCADCGYVARTTATWIAQLGAPLCPCNRQAMTVA